MSPTCRGCHAPIHWLKTHTGGSMPVDPTLTTAWLSQGDIYCTSSTPPEEVKAWAERSGITWPLRRLVLVTPEGDTVSGYEASPITMHVREVTGYQAHWASCPQAQTFKR